MKLVLGFVLICIALVGLGNGKLQSNTVDVTRFGAVGDKKTDDSKAFVKAWRKVCGKKGSQTLKISNGKTFKLQPLVFQGPCKSTTITFRSLAFRGCNNLQLKSITSINSARNHISVRSCIGVTISYVNLIAPKDSPNTDGINVSGSSQVNIFDSTIGTGDDCVAINGGCSGINITNVKCGGPGHGLSVGSLGKEKTVNDIVEHVYVKNCTFNGTQNGARIKTVPGGAGYAKNILFEDIKLINTENPIVIDQHYGCKQYCPPTNSAVEVSNVKFIGFHGSAIKELAIQLNCSEVKRCNDIVLDNISIVPAKEGETLEVICNNVGGTVQHTIPPVSCLSKP